MSEKCLCANVFTVVVVAGEIFGVDEEVVVSVQLPEFTINDIEVFIREIIGDLINVILLLQQSQSLYTHTFCTYILWNNSI